MHLAIVYNPLSGKGKAPAHARTIRAHLNANAHTTDVHEVGPAAVRSDLDAALAHAHAIIVIGGDGTVHALAPKAAHHNTPLYHFPTGTENLFAREFGMSRDLRDLDTALHNLDRHNPAAHAHRIDIPRCNDRPFLLMASLGTDANVVHRLAHNRTGRINHFSYIPHILNEIASPALPRYTIHADGDTLVNKKRGWAVIANARQYALRVDPAPHADPADGMLDLVFCPAYTTLSMLGWFVRARTRNHLRSPKVVAARAKEIIIESERPAHYQLDGEAPIDHADDPDLGPPNTPLHATIGHATLPVMRVAAPQNAHASARHRPAGTQRHSTQHAHQPEAAPQTMPAPQRP